MPQVTGIFSGVTALFKAVLDYLINLKDALFGLSVRKADKLLDEMTKNHKELCNNDPNAKRKTIKVLLGTKATLLVESSCEGGVE